MKVYVSLGTLAPSIDQLPLCCITVINLLLMFHQTLMSVRSLASVLMGAVRTSLVLTAACAMRVSSHLLTAKVAVVSNAYLIFTWLYLD